MLRVPMRNSHCWLKVRVRVSQRSKRYIDIATSSDKLGLRQLFSGKEHMSDDSDSDLEVWSEGCNKKSTRPTKEIRFSQINLRCPNRW